MADRSNRRGGPVDQLTNRRNAGETGWADGKAESPGTPSGDADYFGGIRRFSNYKTDPASEPTRGKGDESGQKP